MNRDVWSTVRCLCVVAFLAGTAACGGTQASAPTQAHNPPAPAASAFATPAFQTQWMHDEAIAPGSWGLPDPTRPGTQEIYQDAPDRRRIVQYFAKGRMELTNGKVTSGLLASELVQGRLQTGDAMFDANSPPAIPIAGDPGNPGPTYAALMDKAASLLTRAASTPGAPITTIVAADGTVATGSTAAAAAPVIAAFDAATKHNVPDVFVNYRNITGLPMIGLAISEPFRVAVNVAGKPQPVLVQVFERRVLTYTVDNPDPYKVEMGNVGQHYYQWRYGCGIAANAPPAASADGAIAFGVDHEQGRLVSLTPVAQYTNTVGVAPRIVHYFLDWDSGATFNPAINDAIVACGATPLLTWNPTNGDKGVKQPQYTDARIAGGAYDDLLRRWGSDLATWGKPFYLRIGDEMNGNWDSWSPGVNTNTIADYIAMWRHVVTVMRETGNGLPNVRFVWSPNVISPGANFVPMYPGDDYVDWVGLDGYNWGTVRDIGWESFPEVFEKSYTMMTKLTQKPLMIPEIGVVEQGGDKAAWMSQTFLTDIPTRFPRIKAIVYFDEDASVDHEGDWRVETSTASLAAFQQVAHAPFYQGRLT
ncbi:MAG: hypothetical protein LC793_06820 [Thermomicrobia bacterium]|nr:hypothetical protein [Thermomicrobia bacterium]